MTKKIKETSRRIIMIIANGKELEKRCISLRS